MWLYILSPGMRYLDSGRHASKSWTLLVKWLFVVGWSKLFSNYYRLVIGVSPRGSVSILLGARILTMDEGKYKYGREQEGKEGSCWDGLQLGVTVWIYAVNISFVCCKEQEVKKLWWKWAYVEPTQLYDSPQKNKQK